MRNVFKESKMYEDQKQKDELEFERAKSKRLERQSKENSTSFNLIFAGGVGLTAYGISGFSFSGGLLSFLIFVGLGAYLNKSM